MGIFIHRYLYSDSMIFKVCLFCAIYLSMWTSVYSSDIKVLNFFDKPLLNNIFQESTCMKTLLSGSVIFETGFETFPLWSCACLQPETTWKTNGIFLCMSGLETFSLWSCACLQPETTWKTNGIFLCMSGLGLEPFGACFIKLNISSNFAINNYHGILDFHWL